MAKILKREKLADKLWRYRLDAPRIAKKRLAGQFIILRPVQQSERIPLTIANADALEGWIEIIFQTVGRTTMLLESLPEGGDVLDLVGPLGRPTHIEKYGRCVCIGGGVGVAPLYPIVAGLRSAGNHITAILGARTKELLILEQEFEAMSDTVHVATDDGSCGSKGFVSDVFQSLIDRGERFDAAFVIGPVMMMKATSALTVKAGVTTWVSLNPIMIDGTGMCGGCRVTVGGATKFACVDGPEFNAAEIDWDEMIHRLSTYRPFEDKARQGHECKLEKA
ncbi:MAG: sulfide/dihydroorotate dehydrogenase-like FAD/NAD-binding protein [Chitinispirillaceae bacterium]|nr:sulfide/dihydroorotate dehydrogenase-like FAD/NAD-binding protein [Chitinispirillaceae bacterium]